MSVIGTLLKEINGKVSCGDVDGGLGLYEKLLRDKGLDWKARIVRHIVDVCRDTGLYTLFTYNYADMLIIDRDNHQVILLWIAQNNIQDDSQQELYEWVEAIHDTLEEETLEEYGYAVKVLHVVNTLDAEVLKEFKYENEYYYQDIPSEIDFGKYIPKDIAYQTPKNDCYEDFISFCSSIASDLTDLGAPRPEEVEDEVKVEVEDEPHYNILNTAPSSFTTFLEKNSKAIAKKDLEEIFSLSLHSIFVGNTINKQEELLDYFKLSLIDKSSDNGSITTVSYDMRDIEDKNTFKNSISDKKNTIILIKNIDTSINPLFTFKKSDLIRILCQALDNSQSTIFILSASAQGWKEMVAEYPLLRVFFQNIFFFEDLSVKNLLKHFVAEVKVKKNTIADDAIQLAEDFFTYIKGKGKIELFDFSLSTMLAREARYYQAIRSSNDNDTLGTAILKQDIENAIKDEYLIEEPSTLKHILQKMDKLTGLENVKTSIKDLGALVKINRLRSEGQKHSLTPISLNSLFIGNPGTGKTTVANILGEVYKSIGVLTEGHIIAISRQDIVAQWIGHTEENMKQYINKAYGGILFIDEAYSLYQEDNDRDFGKEAINVLVDKLEQIKEHTCVILAGYPKPMEKFMNANPGLASRFPHTITFADYSAEDLNKIFRGFLRAEELTMSSEADVLMTTFINTLVENKDENFGNARTCRNVFEKLKLIQARRIIYAEENNTNNINVFTKEDVQMLSDESGNDDSRKKKSIGYKLRG